jgi:hypothetical protein
MTQSFWTDCIPSLKKSGAPSQNLSTIHGRDTPSGSHIAEKVKQVANICNMSVVLLPDICYLLSYVMSSPVILSANAFIQLKEYEEQKHSFCKAGHRQYVL